MDEFFRVLHPKAAYRYTCWFLFHSPHIQHEEDLTTISSFHRVGLWRSVLTQLSQPEGNLTLPPCLLGSFWGLPVPRIERTVMYIKSGIRMQNEVDRMQTGSGQVYGKLSFTGQGRSPEQAQEDSLVGKKSWGWEDGMGRLLCSPTWAEVDLHQNTQLSQALAKQNISEPCDQGSNLLTTHPLGS